LLLIFWQKNISTKAARKMLLKLNKKCCKKETKNILENSYDYLLAYLLTYFMIFLNKKTKNFQVLCDVTSTSGSKTLFSEVSAPFETGIVVAVDDGEAETSLNLIKNGDTKTITVKQMLPLACTSNDNCILVVNIIQVPEGLNPHKSSIKGSISFGRIWLIFKSL
jgi:hypothetical protein